jgi:hypothetical protein
LAVRINSIEDFAVENKNAMSVDLLQYDRAIDEAISRCMAHHFTNAFGPKKATRKNRKRRVKVCCCLDTSADPLKNMQLKLHHRAFGNSEIAKKARRCIVMDQERHSNTKI